MRANTLESAGPALSPSVRSPSGVVVLVGTAMMTLAGCLLLVMATIRPGW